MYLSESRIRPEPVIPWPMPPMPPHAHTHDFETVREQRNRPAITEIDDYLRAFAGSENDIVGWQRRGEQTAVGSDLMEASAIVEPEMVKACVRAIDQSQSEAIRLRFEDGFDNAIDQHRVTHHSHHDIMHSRGVNEASVARESAVLNDQRNIIDAIIVRKVERLACVVADVDHSGQTLIDLWPRAAVRMRMIPEHRCALADIETRGPAASRLDRLMRSAIGARRQMKTVPVDGCRFGQIARDIHPHRIARVQLKRGAEIGLVDTDGRRFDPFKKLRDAVA